MTQVTEVFGLIAEVAIASGSKGIKDLPGVWDYSFGDWRIRVNGHAEAIDVDGSPLAPYTARIDRMGWPAAIVSPFEGQTIGHIEDEVIEALAGELARLSPKQEGLGL